MGITQNDYVVSLFAYLLTGMFNGHYGLLLIPLQRNHCGVDLFAAYWVKFRCRLVQNNDRWIHGKYSCNGKTLFLTSGKLACLPLFISIKANLVQCALYPFLYLIPWYEVVPWTKSSILIDGTSKDLGFRVLQDKTNLPCHCLYSVFAGILAPRYDRTLHGTLYELGDDSIREHCKGRLPRPCASHYNSEFTLLNGKVYIFQDL